MVHKFCDETQEIKDYLLDRDFAEKNTLKKDFPNIPERNKDIRIERM